MAEWLKAHAWKACLGQPNAGSNPAPSATILLNYMFLLVNMAVF